MNNKPCIVRPMLINLNPDEFHYNTFIVGLGRCDKVAILLKNDLAEYVCLLK